MEIKTKYIVLQDKYANWIINNAKRVYSSLYQDNEKQTELNEYFNNNFEIKTFVHSNNDLTLQTIMAFENEESIASLQLNTFPKKRDIFKSAEKPLFISKIFYNQEVGLIALLEKIKTIASQKNYDLVFGEVLAVRTETIKSIDKNGFEITTTESSLNGTTLETIIFKLS